MSAGRILVVEDDSTQLNLLRRALISAGYEVMAFGDGEAAAAAVEVSEFDAAVVDWKLPGRDGLDLLELVREKRPDAAFVMVTAYGTIAHAVQAVQAGADDYLAKPFERPALLMAVEKALRSRRLEGENRRLSAELGKEIAWWISWAKRRPCRSYFGGWRKLRGPKPRFC